MEPTVIAWVGVGVIARVIVPYLQTLKEHPDTKFDKAFLVPPLISAVISVITLPLVLDKMPMDVSSPIAAFVWGWGSTDVIREIQKLFSGPR